VEQGHLHPADSSPELTARLLAQTERVKQGPEPAQTPPATPERYAAVWMVGEAEGATPAEALANAKAACDHITFKIRPAS
jgi:hypothetical protein